MTTIPVTCGHLGRRVVRQVQLQATSGPHRHGDGPSAIGLNVSSGIFYATDSLPSVKACNSHSRRNDGHDEKHRCASENEERTSVGKSREDDTGQYPGQHVVEERSDYPL